MRYSLALVLVLTGVAAADPDPEGTPVVPDQPHPPPPEANPPAPPLPPVQDRDAGDRPSEIAFGLGLGYIFPTSLETPNVTSARVRFTNGIQLEPRVVFGNTSSSSTMNSTSSSDGSSQVALAALVRFPMITHRKIDFELIGALGFDIRRVNPDGDNNNTTDTSVALSWGIGISYWFTPHWSMSFTATNPLIAFTSHKQEETPPTTESKTSSTTIGAFFAPVISVMVHLYN